MFPSTTEILLSQINSIFFVSDSPRLAFSAIAADRKLVVVFNSSDSTMYLGGADVSSTAYVEKISPGKVAVSELLSNDDIYCLNESSNMTMIQASQYL